MFEVRYEREACISVSETGQTVLDISLSNGLPHYHACGGNGRCSTCRVLVLSGTESLAPRTPAEDELARKKGLPGNVRLACQARVSGPVTLRRLVLDNQDADEAYCANRSSDLNLPDGCPIESTGREMTLAILFSDIRSFTPFSERCLPYDLVHILNRYFAEIGDSILRFGGYLDKFMGDGLMALFGLNGCDPKESAKSAVRAALDMQVGLDRINFYLKESFDEHFRIGIGVHVGEVVVGEIGHPERRQLTAIGDVVNTASRIESATKAAKTTILISDEVCVLTDGFFTIGRDVRTTLKGKQGTFRLFEVTGITDEAPSEDPDLEDAARLMAALENHISRFDAPGLVRLAFHDTWPLDGTSPFAGPNGWMRFEETYEQEPHRPVKRSFDFLSALRKHLPQVSWADIIAFAGAAAIEKCGGPRIILDLGRIDCEAPPTEETANPLTPDLPIEELIESFASYGFSLSEFVVLSGAHTLGLAEGRPFTDEPFSFDNSYFARLLGKETDPNLNLLASDRALLENEECRALVELYAKDKDAFFRDFAKAWKKLFRPRPHPDEGAQKN